MFQQLEWSDLQTKPRSGILKYTDLYTSSSQVVYCRDPTLINHDSSNKHINLNLQCYNISNYNKLKAHIEYNIRIECFLTVLLVQEWNISRTQTIETNFQHWLLVKGLWPTVGSWPTSWEPLLYNKLEPNVLKLLLLCKILSKISSLT